MSVEAPSPPAGGGIGGAFQMMGKLGISITNTKEPQGLRRRGSRRSKRAGSTGSRGKGRGAGTGQAGSFKRSILQGAGSTQVVVDTEKGRVWSRQLPVLTFGDRINIAVTAGYRRLLLALGWREERKETVAVQEPLVVEEVAAPQRYRPDNLHSLCQATGFSCAEMKRIYRGFKTDCPTGLVTEEIFYLIFSKFFPLGGDTYSANMSSYSHYVFSALDVNDSGIITFEDFALGLSVLLNGSLDEKLRWTFNLYDLNGDGVITKDEMENVTASIYELMGVDTEREQPVVARKVDTVFKKLDLDGDGSVTLGEFLQVCRQDSVLRQSLAAWHPAGEERAR